MLFTKDALVSSCRDTKLLGKHINVVLTSYGTAMSHDLQPGMNDNLKEAPARIRSIGASAFSRQAETVSAHEYLQLSTLIHCANFNSALCP